MRDQAAVFIPLTLVDDDGRRLDYAPAEVAIGIVKLAAWQVHPVVVEPGLFNGLSAYLVKVNYELALEPDLTAMPWFEIGLQFTGEARTTVLDAVPHGSSAPQQAGSYVLNRHLQLVPADSSGAAPAYLPAVDERVDVYGLGSASVRWRHSTPSRAGVRPGSRTAWLVLLAPAGRTQQVCQLSARYDLRPDEDATYRPTQRAATFTISLDDPSESAVRPSATAAHRTEPASDARSVFICYAHESAQFKADVTRFANVLLDEGLDVHLDQFDVGTRKNWRNWAQANFVDCEFTLPIASPRFREVGEGRFVENQNSGLRNEITILETYYQRHPEWHSYVLPVILPGRSNRELPVFLGPESCDYYKVDDYTPRGVAYLVDAIRKTERRTFRLE